MSHSDDDSPKLEFELESPPAVDGGSNATFFGDESLVGAIARGAAVEGFLNALTANISFQDFMREILLAFMRAIKCEAGSVLELDHAQSSFFFRAVVGQASDKISEFRVPVTEGIVGHVAETRLPILVDDLHQNQRHLRTISDAVGFEARNMVAVPLVIRGKLYGVIELLNRVGEHSFTPADQSILAATAPLASKAIEVRLMLAHDKKAA